MEYLTLCLIVSPFALAFAWFMGRGVQSPKPKKISFFL